jgi:hypothetical protein
MDRLFTRERGVVVLLVGGSLLIGTFIGIFNCWDVVIISRSTFFPNKSPPTPPLPSPSFSCLVFFVREHGVHAGPKDYFVVVVVVVICG